MSSHLQTHLTTSVFNVLYRFSGIKNPPGGGFKLCGEATTLNRISRFLRT
ncbi:hypothetical protein SFK227_2657 [Shigella flexneri K-227]|uniref:Uncharacterized protein n=3 Tax=Shigella flexneri TaxID=623 RepID=F5NWY5_SHIFL|nr:hypothetical protein SFy_0938 [Shigella flexneri 2003036]AIL39587.1 hypothetical protein SFyv_0975 [Shigella flexneri Shi06HN006]EDU66696.1 hypothetical protein Ec53638_4012 [Escherichia coli 53638]EFS14942.1 hypothetical protein SF2457T_0004 [Shigella flexneri 2a str. 2457T]EFZ57670.1 hypothetical protein ECLT68_3397 [Escherichia coli LT-68]EFZ69306.1 hypothetical protein ECOK1357_2717 [Escherichia coli OK1357]EGJ90446.1 hypothetical protein SF434370_0920 [Shigella flexneri 4343-70]EGJ93